MRTFSAALLLLFAACGPAIPERQARPAMWLVADADTRIYLLGTMHALPAGTDWTQAKVAEAIASADELVLELTPAELAKAGPVFQALAPRTEPLPIEKRLSGQALVRYRALEASGRRFDADGYDDWAVMVLMGQRAAQNARLSPRDGVETGLARRFAAAGKPIRGLETAQEQLMMFETLDPRTQRILLTRAADGAHEAASDAADLTAAWGRGDVTALERVVNEDIDIVPAARQAIISDRNRRWSAWAKQRMTRPGTVLIAVGAGHLVGADGMPALLVAEGLSVTRVQ